MSTGTIDRAYAATPGREVRIRGQAASGFPWLLFFVVWLLMFPLDIKMDAPAHPAEEQSSSELAKAAEEGSPIARVVIVSMGALGSVLLFRNRFRIRAQGKLFWIMLAFFGWTFLTGLWADDPTLTTRRLISLALMLLFSAGCAARLDAERLSIFIAGIAVLDLVPGLYAELHYGTFLRAGARFAGAAPHANVQAAILSVTSILFCWLAWAQVGSRRLRFSILALVAGIFLVLTGSRTAVLAACASLAFSFVLIVLRDHKHRLPVLVAFVCLCASLGALLDLSITVNTGVDPVGHSLERKGDENGATSLNGRIDLWKQLLGFAAKRPVSGYGYGGFWTPARIEIVSEEQTWAIQQSHSAYIEELLSLGAPGALLYIALLLGGLGVCISRFFRHQDIYGGWASVLVFFAIHNVTEAINVTPLFTSRAFILMMLSLTIANANLPSDERSGETLHRSFAAI